MGNVKPKMANEIDSSNWIIGCETLDRDFANYDSYKEYLVPLGIRKIRLQGGWAKTEKIKGQYDWKWLDHIINDAVKRGLKPWLQISYGNPIYPGGGGSALGAGLPHSEEALTAWDNFATAMVRRYKDRVDEWEIWNEGNFGDNLQNTPDFVAAINIRTIDIIKKLQPNAKVSGLSLGHIDLKYADQFFKILKDRNKLHLFDNITYHDYVYNPDANDLLVEKLRDILKKYDSKVKLRQGENGAPSGPGFGRGALGDYNWTELSQAKWNTRRMLSNLGHDVESSVFTISDIAYTSGPIKLLNIKGLLQSDSTKKILRPKLAYRSVQVVASIFDHSLERITDIHPTYEKKVMVAKDAVRYTKGTDRSLAVYGYIHRKTKQQIYTIWSDEGIPTNINDVKILDFSFINGNFNEPVLVDIITGKVFEIPKSNWSKEGNIFNFKKIPVYDGPILIADKSLITY
ncbi:hypothetical protein EZ428_19235 [Pedobacter frigiditerrae]|uniref:Glycosyl hydrolases family 39 n=1 Tax=Pedobacter frigiditerrae TaxID=2530452 RepID=A0A4R0MPM7_9SPHI|nr:hypothetical protein EZ428_19235 [Pedobacter frigiditerrae]